MPPEEIKKMEEERFISHTWHPRVDDRGMSGLAGNAGHDEMRYGNRFRAITEDWTV